MRAYGICILSHKKVKAFVNGRSLCTLISIFMWHVCVNYVNNFCCVIHEPSIYTKGLFVTAAVLIETCAHV